MSTECIIAIDQGTTSTRSIIFDKNGIFLASHQQEHAQIYPNPGWVEHDAKEIWFCTQNVIREALAQARSKVGALSPVAIGITNQRETFVVWDKKTGEPIHNAIVWQCTRTQDFCSEWGRIKEWEQSQTGCGKVKDRTGLLISTYF